MRTSTRSGKQRLEPAAFFNAAMKILGERGAEELTVDSVCAHLGVTKGSFYHHFENTAEFTAGLLTCWEGVVDQYLELTRAIADPARQLEALWPAGINRPHEAETALRAWANSNPTVAAVVRRADRKMESFAVEWLDSFLDDPERARLLAHMWLCLILGTQQQRPVDRQLLQRTWAEFLRTNLGIEFDVDGDRLQVHRMPGPARERPRSTRGRETVRRKST